MSEQNDYLRARLSRRAFLKGAAVAGTALGAPTLWSRPAKAAGSAPVTRYVGFGADPRREAVVSFASAGPFRNATVEYGTDDTFGMTAAVDLRTVRGVPTVYGHGALRGLQPGTRYRYRVRLDDTVTEATTLTTAPSRAEPFTFTAFGDQGVSSAARSVMRRVGALRPAFHLLAGDLCYADSSGQGSAADVFDPTVWDSWLSMIEPVAASTPWMCATGNHDMEPGYGALGYDGYLDRFLVPANGATACPSTYTFRYGNVGVVSLDANDVSYEIPHNRGYSHGAQTAWLERELKGLRSPGSGIDFVVVFFHHCAYTTSATHGCEGGVREEWVPLFDTHQVDLVINGHAHLYERTSLLRNGHIVAPAARGARVDSRQGTTYITAGGGGRTVDRTFVPDGSILVGDRGAVRQAAPWSLPTKTSRHSFLAVGVTPGDGGSTAPTMAIRAFDKHGALIDEVTLVREESKPGGPGAEVLGVSAAGVALAAVGTGTALWRHGRRKEAVTAQNGG